MRNWLRETVNRRHLLWGSLATASGSLIGGAAATGQSSHAGHGSAPPYDANGAGHHSAHGNMITVGEVDNARNGFDPTSLLTDWDTGIVSIAAGRPHAAHLRDHRRGQGDRDRAGHLLPGLDLQRPGARPEPARHRGRPRSHHLPERRARTPIPCISTASTRPAWTAFPAPARSALARSSSTSSTPSRSAAISITATPCR